VNEIQGELAEIVNAAKATLYGVEGDVTFLPTPHWLFAADGSLLSAKYDQFTTGDSSRPYLGALNLAGNTLDQAPPYKFDVSGQYKWDVSFGEAALKLEYSASGKVYFSPYNLSYIAQKAYGDLNAYLTFTNDDARWAVSLFALNLTDEIHYSAKGVDSVLIGSPAVGYIAPPRTFGVTLSYKL
jgi:iron complex outermembrane receptor protein